MNSYILLAKQSVESYIKEGKIISPPGNLPEEFLKRKSGTFVTIKNKDKLRGCIGTYLPTKINIAEEIIYNAITAATKDYRFSPIQEKELSSLSYTVYILSEPEMVKDIKELDAKKFGIIIKTAPITSPHGTDVVFTGHFVAKTWLLLPNLEGINTIEKQISIAYQKGAIDPRREKIIIYRFAVEKYQ